MNFRFTLSNDALGSEEISEPDGWKDSKIILEHHDDFSSLVEYYEGAAGGGFIFYGDNEQENGGINFLKSAEQLEGFDTNVSISTEFSFDDSNYQSIFNGLVDISEKNETPDNKIQAPIIRDDFWVKLINRIDTPVNLSSAEDIDGNPVDIVEPIVINLKNQKLQQKYDAWFGNELVPGQNFQLDYVEYSIPANQYGQIDFDNEVLDEIEEKNFLPRLDNPTIPQGLFTLEYAGDYSFDLWLTVSTTPLGSLGSRVNNLEIRIQINDASPVSATKAHQGVDGINGSTLFTYTATQALNAGDQVKIYFENTTGSTNAFFCNGGYLRITASTIYPDTIAYGYHLHDVFFGIFQRLGLGNDPFYSDYLGSPITLMKQYDDYGCGARYVILKGMQIRQYSLTEKPFFISFNQAWNGANPILNLCLTYEDSDDSPDRQIIRIQEKEYTKNVTTSINISNIQDISSSYDKNHIFKTIKSGYKKWETDDSSGLDETQSKRTFASPFIKTGKELNIESDFIAGCWPIEKTRRTTRKKSADYKYDNDNFIIAIDLQDSSPDILDPELQNDDLVAFACISPDTRYNIRLTATRNIYRWLNYASGCMQNHLSSSFKFVAGEGNFAAFTRVDDPCPGNNNGVAFIEQDNISPSESYMFLPMVYRIETPMEIEDLNIIRANRRNAIGISQVDSGHQPFFIKKLEYNIVSGRAIIHAWPKTFFEIQVIDSEFTMDTCTDAISSGSPTPGDCDTDSEGSILREDGSFILREDGSKILLE